MNPYNSFIISRPGAKISCKEYGNINGRPVLIFHGGPGVGFNVKTLNIFDPEKFRLITFDQRGCAGSVLDDDGTNTTQEIIEDAKSILDHLNISKIAIFGGSWGSTVSLLFAEKYTELVDKMFLFSTFLARQQDVDWIFNGSKIFYQDLFDELNGCNILYSNYEDNLGHLETEFEKDAYHNSSSRKIFSRFYEKNFFIEENQILNNIDKIENIPVMILHSRLDINVPVSQSILLSKKMKKSKLIIVPEIGHFGSKMKEELKNQISFLEV